MALLSVLKSNDRIIALGTKDFLAKMTSALKTPKPDLLVRWSLNSQDTEQNCHDAACMTVTITMVIICAQSSYSN